MQIAFFEDASARQFAPIALMRPVFELVCGHFSLRERWQFARAFEAKQDEWGAFVRPELAETYRESRPEFAVNDLSWLYGDSTLLINGRWLADPKTLENLTVDEVAVVGDTIVALHVDPLEAPLLDSRRLGTKRWPEIARIRRRVELPGMLLNYPWDLVHQNPRQIAADFRLRGLGRQDSEVGAAGRVDGAGGEPVCGSVGGTASLRRLGCPQRADFD